MTYFFLAFGLTFPLVFASELRPDTVLCEGGALAARYRGGPVFIGSSLAFLVKMLLAACFYEWALERVPPQFTLLPRLIAAVTLLYIAYRLVSTRVSSTEDSAATPVAPWTKLERSSMPAGRIIALTFLIILFSEWIDGSCFIVMRTVDSYKVAGQATPVAAILGAGIGGAMGLICREAVAILAGSRIRSFFTHRRLRLIFAAGCIVAAVVTVFREPVIAFAHGTIDGIKFLMRRS